MKLKSAACLLLLSTIYLMPSCTTPKGCTNVVSIDFDSDAEEDDGSCRLAGSGGNVTLVAFPKHHDEPIISGSGGHSDSVYVKFNSLESPGTNLAAYDLKIAGDDGDDHVRIIGLKPGKYFIYMTGWDSTSATFVKGGIPYTLTSTSGEIELNIPVSENH